MDDNNNMVYRMLQKLERRQDTWEIPCRFEVHFSRTGYDILRGIENYQNQLLRTQLSQFVMDRISTSLV